MKIALVAYLHGNGGAERQITKLANEMAHKGYDVQMLVMAEYNLKYPINDSVSVQNLTYAEKNYFHPIFGRFWALRKAYKSFQPDVTIHFNYQSVYLTIFNSTSIRGKIIFAERGDPSNKSDYPILLRMLRCLTNRATDGFVFQTNGAQNYFGESVKTKSIVIPNSVSIKEGMYPKVISRNKTIVNVGRLHLQKNQEMLIRAFKIISTNYPDYSMEIYGDGELRDKLQKLIDDLELTSKVFLRGTSNNIFEIVRKASLFVLSSDFEGMPNALMEAMALGVPSISTDCNPGGARDLIKDGVNGWITPINDVKALAIKMSYVLSHPKEAEQVAEKGMNIVKTHSDERIYSMWSNFINVINKSW